MEEFQNKVRGLVIEKYVENPLSAKVLKGEIKEGDTIKVDLDRDSKLTFKTKTPAKTTAAAEEKPAE